MSNFEPIKKYCHVDTRGDEYVVSFLAKDIAHEGYNTFGTHIFVFKPSSVLILQSVYGQDIPTEDLWGKRIAKIVTDFNTAHPNYDFPDATFTKLFNIIEKETDREIKKSKSDDLDRLWYRAQDKVTAFLEVHSTN